MFLVLVVAVLGNSNTATKLQNDRKISLSGEVSGEAIFNGSKDVNIETTPYENFVNLNLSNNGFIKIKRTGKVVCATANVTCPADGSILSNQNKAVLPEWAIPSSQMIIDNEVKGSTTSNMSGNCFGYIRINTAQNYISTVINNTSNVDIMLTLNITYMVE
ncbi:MAG: hypothetical protein ACLVAK_07915 [Clostridia bacterium]|jgi:hypothetical protein